jgi:hypothetical protein
VSKDDIVCSITFRTSASLVMSALTASKLLALSLPEITFVNFERSLPTRITLHPSLTRRSVVDLPTPPPAPVTIATFPLRLISINISINF